MKKELIKEFCDRFNLKQEEWNKFLKEYEDNIPLRELSDKYNVNYNALRYLFYSLGFVNNSKASRIESVMLLQKELARENGQDYVLADEMEKELETVLNKNRQLVRSLTHARDENNSLRKMMRISDRKSNVEEKMLEEFEKALSELTFTTPKVIEKQITKTNTPLEGLSLVLSDMHFGSVVKEDEVPKNSFNYKIAHKRLTKVIDEVIAYPFQSKNITVFNLFDDLLGKIHNGIYNTEGGFTTSFLELLDAYVYVYSTLASCYDTVKVVSTLDNHSRKTEKPASDMKWDNFNVMILKMAEKVLQAKGIHNVEISYTRHDYNFTEINGAGIFVMHSDSQRNYKPYVESAVSKVQDVCLHIFDKKAKHFINGHFHFSCVVDNQYGGKCISNGSMVGDTTYGVNNGFSSITPSQTIFFVNKEGNIEDFKVVNLSKII